MRHDVQHIIYIYNIKENPMEERFNRDGELEVLGCWIAVMRRQGGKTNPHQPVTSNDMYPQQHMARNSSVCLHLFTFALMTTGAVSPNVSKLFSVIVGNI